MHQTFRGKRYRFDWMNKGEPFLEGARGICENREQKGRVLRMAVRKNLEDPFLLKVLIHEGLHAAFGRRLKEKDIDRASMDIGQFLWRLGYRNQNQSQNQNQNQNKDC